MTTQAKSLLQLSWPLVISFTARSLLTSIDLPYASRLPDADAALAAIGLSFPLEFAFIACWVGTSAALTSHLSRAMGERCERRIEQLRRTTLGIVVALAALFLALATGIALFADALLGDRVSPAVVSNFRVYAPVLLAGVALVGFWSTIPDSIVKAHHDTRSTMIAGLITGVGNLLLNTLFLFVFELGIFGIALATGLARAGSLSYALWRAHRLEEARRTRWAKEGEGAAASPSAGVRADGCLERPLRALLALAVPSALTFVLMGSENFAVNWILARYPEATASIAAYAIYHRAVLLALMPIIATGVAVLPFAARHLGEGNLPEVERGLRQAFVLSVVYILCVVFPLCLGGGAALADFLAEGAATRGLVRFAVRYAVPLGALAAFPFVLCRPAFEAVQRGTPGLLMALLRYLVLSVPLGLFGAHIARQRGLDPFYGLAFGLIGGTAVVSLAFTGWLMHLFLDLRRRAGSPAHTALEGG